MIDGEKAKMAEELASLQKKYNDDKKKIGWGEQGLLRRARTS